MKETVLVITIFSVLIWFAIYGALTIFVPNPNRITLSKKCRYYARDGKCIQYEYGNHGKKFILKEIK